MFTDEQLEYIYGAVKEAYQTRFNRTLVNDPISLSTRKSDKKRMDQYMEIMNIINQYLKEKNI